MSLSGPLSGEGESRELPNQRATPYGPGMAGLKTNRWVAAAFALSVTAQMLHSTRVALLMLLAAALGFLIDLWCQRKIR